MASDKQAAAYLQNGDQLIQVGRLMVVPDADPKKGFSLGYAWWPDGWYQQALPGDLSSQLQCLPGIPYRQGNDLGWLAGHIPPLQRELVPHLPGIFQYLLPAGGKLIDPAKRTESGCCQGCGRGRGKDITTGCICQPLD